MNPGLLRELGRLQQTLMVWGELRPALEMLETATRELFERNENENFDVEHLRQAKREWEIIGPALEYTIKELLDQAAAIPNGNPCPERLQPVTRMWKIIPTVLENAKKELLDQSANLPANTMRPQADGSMPHEVLVSDNGTGTPLIDDHVGWLATSGFSESHHS
jgi:hypothetical protein